MKKCLYLNAEIEMHIDHDSVDSLLVIPYIPNIFHIFTELFSKKLY